MRRYLPYLDMVGARRQWNFRSGALAPGATLTRASTGYYFNGAGVLVSASNDVARFTFDPVTRAFQGLLVEPQSTNSITYSNDLTNTGWAANNATVTAAARTGIDGTASASTIKEDGTTNVHNAGFSTVSFTNGLIYPVSAVVENVSGSRWFQISIAATHAINFNPADGTIGTTTAQFSGVQSTNLGSNRWRISGLFTANATSSGVLRCSLITGTASAANQSYAGDNASTLAVHAVQFETAGVPGTTSPIPTAGSTVTRSADVLTLAAPNGIYTVNIERLSGVTSLTGQVVSAATYTVPTDASPLQRITMRRTP